jgi:hypothetical protein
MLLIQSQCGTRFNFYHVIEFNFGIRKFMLPRGSWHWHLAHTSLLLKKKARASATPTSQMSQPLLKPASFHGSSVSMTAMAHGQGDNFARPISNLENCWAPPKLMR